MVETERISTPAVVDEGLNAKLQEIAGCKLAIVPIQQFDLLEKNARFMRNETFRNLVSNIQSMGFQQLPFCLRTSDFRYKVLSGNHRVKAAIEAGKTEIPTLYTDADLTESEQIAIQLSHNSITGQDDQVILKEVFEAIESVELKYFAGLDDKVLAELQKLPLPPLSELRIDFRAVSLMFLPDEVEKAEAVFDLALKSAFNKDVWLSRVSEFNPVMDALAKTAAAHNVRNTATAFMLILAIFEKHIGDLEAGWIEREKGGEVPIASVLGSDMIPLKTAKLLKKAIDTAISRDEADPKALHKLLEKWATPVVE